MRYLPNGECMKAGDTHTIMDIGMPSMVLMERAALGCVTILEKKQMNLSRVLIVCGAGNNGGDGFAIARLLLLKGKNVTTVFVGKKESCTEETTQQMEIFTNYGFSFEQSIPSGEFSAIIDCMFGIGLSRNIQGRYYSIIEELNKKTGKKIAIDIPSGISSSTGEVLGIGFQANLTITLAFEKLGMVMYPGRRYVGVVDIVDIGIPATVFKDERNITYTYDLKDIPDLLPKRDPNTHKGTYGKVLMIVGSQEMSGAAYLSSKAAYVVGAGLVKIYTREENRQVLQQLLPEAIIVTYCAYEEEELRALLSWADVVAIGSGLGTDSLALCLVEGTFRMVSVPCIIDADGLNLLAENERLWSYMKMGNYVLTPHMKEMSRLLNCSIKELQDHRLEFLSKLVQTFHVTCVLKDARTCAASPNEHTYVNMSGNNSMAKGGSGDVLAGMIAGFLAQNLSTHSAATVGVYLHGLSGDYARKQKGSYSVLASDIVESISSVINQSEKENNHDESV